MISDNPNGYRQAYYQNTASVSYKIGTDIKLNGISAFTGVLYGPTLFATGEFPGLHHVIAVMRFGDLKNRLIFNQNVKVQVPAWGETV